MVQAKAKRSKKRQMGQFMTPEKLAEQITKKLAYPWSRATKILEPSFGRGAFIFAVVEELLKHHGSRSRETIDYIFANQIFGIELDEDLYEETLAALEKSYGPITKHNLQHGDFFKAPFIFSSFDLIIGNPPFGGTFDPSIEDELDRRFGLWNGVKLKKETYSFFIAASLDLLAERGRLVFICSDTFLTIKTMSGLRMRLMDQAKCSIYRLDYFSDETMQQVLVLDAEQSMPQESIQIDGELMNKSSMALTGNFSWAISSRYEKYFGKETIGDFLVCTSGMTIGDNSLFVREIQGGSILETFKFEYFDDPVSLEREVARARLNRISPQMQKRILEQEKLGITKRNVKFIELDTPIKIELPNPDYLPYNKAIPGIVYRPFRHVIFWKNDGEAVLTYKQNGAWYLHGVGGAKYFKREGLTWSLVSPKINMRYLETGAILDSGAPCAFLKEGVPVDEMWFIFAWCLSDLATEILKSVINHTRNIQGKDIERLPYPFWVSESNKRFAIEQIKKLVNEARAGREFDRKDQEIVQLSTVFEYNEAKVLSVN